KADGGFKSRARLIEFPLFEQRLTKDDMPADVGRLQRNMRAAEINRGLGIAGFAVFVGEPGKNTARVRVELREELVDQVGVGQCRALRLAARNGGRKSAQHTMAGRLKSIGSDTLPCFYAQWTSRFHCLAFFCWPMGSRPAFPPNIQECCIMLQRMRSLAKWIWLFVIVGFVGVWGVGEVSGLLGGGGTGGSVTRGTAVAKVNGTTITYDTWLRAREQQIQQAQAQSPAPLTLDDDKRIEDATFEDLVNSVLLQQEYQKRGISVTNEEIQQAAQQQPPPQFMSNPDFQTNGQFDMDKYRRFLSSPIAREQGVLVQLEQYYRDEIPREKLFEQVATQVYVTDARLWRIWQDTHDSAQVSFVRFDPDAIPDSAVHITDAEINQYFVTQDRKSTRLNSS